MTKAGRDDELVFLPLGGAGEIGMNLNCYGYGPPDARKWMIVDCGIFFGRETDTPGVDIIMPDIRFLIEQRDDVLGIVLTHAHEDHLGAIAWLWPHLKCPVYATPFTARILANKLEERGLETQLKVNNVALGGAFTLGPFGVQLVTITHSIPEPNVVIIRTPLGPVVHTGDWKLDPDPLIGETTNDAELRKLGGEGVLALVCDSTNALVSGETGSEADVRKSLHDLVGTLKGRVAVTAFASNLARLELIAKAGRAHGREIVVVGRAMRQMIQAARDTGYLKGFPATLDEEESVRLPPERLLYLVAGSQGEPRGALSRIAAGEHPIVAFGPGDAVIFSSRIIPGNELPIFALHNKLAALGVEVLTEQDHFVHVSGHPAKEDLAAMYGWVKPKIAIPIHGELRHMSEHARFARSLGVAEAVIATNGHMVRLAPGKASIIDEAPSGRLHLDGQILVSEGDGFANARRALGFAGFIGITLVLDNKGRAAADPVLHMEGLPESVREAVAEAVGRMLSGRRGKSNVEEVKEGVRRVARRAANEIWGKKPVVRVETVEV